MKRKPMPPGSIEEYNEEQLQKIHVVESTQNGVMISKRDLKELLFRYPDDHKIRINNHLLYQLLVDRGIKVKGFHPNKTALRAYGLSLNEINAILPGSYTSKEGDGRRKGNPKKTA